MAKIIYMIIALALVRPGFAQDSTARKLDEMITAYTSMGRFNGSALVAAHGKVLLQKGYGFKDAAAGTKNDENTQFEIASITKQFTAAVVLKMVEMKKMQLQDRLSKYYKGFENGDSITIEQMLTHTSGLHSFTETDSAISETDERRMVPYLKTLKPDFKPGTDWHYSNTNYVLLGYIIEKVSGLSYWQAMRKYVFGPLQMNNSGFDFTYLSSPEKAVGYDVLNDTVKQRAEFTDSTVPFGAGSIYSTVEDMYKWHQGLQAHKIVGQALMEKAYTPCAIHNYGYGWQIDSVFGKKMVSHSGAISGFGSNFARIVNDDVCIVLLSNKSGSTFDVMHLTDKLMAVLYNKPYTIPVKKWPVALSEAVLKRYEGTYEIAEMHLTANLFIAEGKLAVQPMHSGQPGPTSIMLATDETHFYDARDEETQARFDIDKDGKVLGLTFVQNGMEKYAKKIK